MTFEKHKVDLVLCGHNHAYSRSKALYTGYDFNQSPAYNDYVTKQDGGSELKIVEEYQADGRTEINRAEDKANGTVYLLNHACGFKLSGKEKPITLPSNLQGTKHSNADGSPWWINRQALPTNPCYGILKITYDTIEFKFNAINGVVRYDEYKNTILNEKLSLVSEETLDSLTLYFTSPNLGDGVLIVTVDDKDWDSYPIKQGSNNVNLGVLPKLSNKVTVYAKDRVGLMSNPIEWTVVCGGIDLTLDFDYNVDYNVGSNIYMPFNIYSPTKDPVTLVMSINGEEKRIPCVQGYNEYVFEDLNVGIHRITLQATDGTFSSAKITFNLVVLNSDSLYLSTTFQDGSCVEYGVPVIIDYRISNPTDEFLTVNQYLDGDLYKTLQSKRGSYSWTLNDLTVKDGYRYRIEVVTSTGERREISGSFDVIQGDFNPVQVNTQGLVYRLDASTRTNQDLGK